MAVSLALHAALLLGVKSSGLTLSSDQPAASVHPRVEIRLLSLASRQEPPVVSVPLPSPSIDAPLPAAPVDHPKIEESAAAEPIAVPPAGFPETVAAKPFAGRPSTSSPDIYLPRSALSRAPVPLTEVNLGWPAGLIPAGRLTGIFWLSISETGAVDRFQSDDSSLPPQLEEVARAAFLAARFEPGQVEGRPAKALIKIEVVFDNRPSSAPAATIASERVL